MAAEIGGNQAVESTSVQVDDAFQVIIIGDCGVGKTSILLRFVKDVFYDNPVAEAGYISDFTKEVAVNGKPVKLHIWDTAGLVSNYSGVVWQSCYLTTSYHFIIRYCLKAARRLFNIWKGYVELLFMSYYRVGDQSWVWGRNLQFLWTWADPC